MSIKELVAAENDTVSRYLVHRQGGLFGGSKNQILTINNNSIGLCDAIESEDHPETYKLADIVKIVPVKGRLG